MGCAQHASTQREWAGQQFACAALRISASSSWRAGGLIAGWEASRCGPARRTRVPGSSLTKYRTTVLYNKRSHCGHKESLIISLKKIGYTREPGGKSTGTSDTRLVFGDPGVSTKDSWELGIEFKLKAQPCRPALLMGP